MTSLVLRIKEGTYFQRITRESKARKHPGVEDGYAAFQE